MSTLRGASMSFIEELKRRNVVRVGVAYVIGGWLLLQLTDVLSELLKLPEQFGPIVVAIVAIGLPIALFLAWAYELTPEGVKREKDVDRSQSITPTTGKRLNGAISVLLVLVIGYLLYDKFSVGGEMGSESFSQTPSGQITNAGTENRGLTPAASTTSETEPVIKRQSIAVLPFANRSNREEDQFFTDGIHDDLLTTIARIGSMKVISRTSVMEYKNTTKKIPEIAKELGVANILEGGIQRSGNQVRINVQLIDAKTDEHLWAEIFDRELTAENLFAIQSEISQKIADALETTLTPSEKDRINTMPTNNLEAYNAYMRGRQLMASRESTKLEQAASEFNRAVELDPDFALAWVGVADSHSLRMAYGAFDRVKGLEIRDTATQRALAIDDQLGEAYTSLGDLYGWRRENKKAETAFKRAIELSPNYATAYHWYALTLRTFPLRAHEQVELMRKAQDLDPRSAIIGVALGGSYLDSGFYSKAERQLLRVLEMEPGFVIALSALAGVYNITSRYDLAMKYSRLAAQQDPGNPEYLRSQAQIYLSIGELEKSEKIRQQLEELVPGDLGNGYFDIWASLVRGNKPAAREAFNWTLPRAQKLGLPMEILGLFEIALGTPERARALFLQSNPGWLEAGSWHKIIGQQQNMACAFAWILTQTGDQVLGEQLATFTTRYLTEDLPAAIEHADIYDAAVCQLVTGNNEQAIASLETKLKHNHLDFYRTQASQFPVFSALKPDPRFQNFLAEYDRLIEIQRLAVAQLDTEMGL